MTIPRNLSNLASGISVAGVLLPSNGGTGLSAPGASGNVLTSDGTNWVSSTSGWTYLSTVNASGAATADVETTFNSTYDTYALVGNNVTVSSTAQISLRFKTGGSYITTTDYAFALVNNTAASSTLTGSFGSGSTAATFVVTSQASTGTTQFVMYVYNPSSTTITKSVSFSGMNRASSTVTTSGNFNGIATLSSVNGLAALTGVRFFPSAGTISGAFRLYGIKAS
jgi:hypothetical protein